VNSPELVAAIAAEGKRMASAAAAAGPDAAIPTCPGWCVRDLVRHQGEVHRWATAIVRDRVPAPGIDSAEVVGPWPDDADLVSWFTTGYATLVETLERADPGLDCFAFLPAASPLLFWSRRQAHETGIHRVDAQSALGPITPFAVDVAVDGIEEMLFGFAGRSRSRLRSPSPRSLQLHAVDAAAMWTVRIGADRVDVDRDDSRVLAAVDGADCAMRGAASDLFLVLWNRADKSALDVAGDAGVLDLWRDTMRIGWR
jgi:uncharacterized protein (TIGR03083 family)